MKASLLFYAVATVATVAASSSAATWRPPARESVSAASGTAKQLLTTAVVPLRVQRLLKRRAPRAAYVPTRLPPGYTYFSHQIFSHRGFDLYFTCCDDNLPLIGFDTDLLRGSEPCNQGPAERVFRIDGVVVGWNAGHNDQDAWRCIRRGGTRLLLTVSGEPPHSEGTSWRTPRQLARMVASARPIRWHSRTLAWITVPTRLVVILAGFGAGAMIAAIAFDKAVFEREPGGRSSAEGVEAWSRS